MPKKTTTGNCVVHAEILELRWERDLNDARHAAVRARAFANTAAGGTVEWTALFYDHPSNGWQVVELTVEKFTAPNTNGASDRVELDALSEPNAASEFERLVGTIVTNERLDGLADDLYELGRRGANRRWKKRYIVLMVDRAFPSREVSHD